MTSFDQDAPLRFFNSLTQKLGKFPQSIGTVEPLLSPFARLAIFPLWMVTWLINKDEQPTKMRNKLDRAAGSSVFFPLLTSPCAQLSLPQQVSRGGEKLVKTLGGTLRPHRQRGLLR
jgi:hypothetical protein